jgi:hypothetical protein
MAELLICAFKTESRADFGTYVVRQKPGTQKVPLG